MQFDVHDDGSIRGHTWRIGDLSVYPQFTRDGQPILPFGVAPAERIGLELASRPYSYADWLTIAPTVAKMLGHIPQTPRTSIHIHVDMDNEPWEYVRNVLIWAYHLEAVLYRLAANGYVHRGERVYNGDVNDHRYARPLSDPIGISWNRTVGPLVRWDQLLAARTASEFAASWGRLDLFWNGITGMPHYCPHRVHMLNLASVLRLGTLEWRIFDGLYRQLPLFMNIVYSVHMLARNGRPSFDPMPLGSQPAIDHKWVSDLLQVDVKPLWGYRWPSACVVHNRLSHYTELTSVPTIASNALQNIFVSGTPDNGSLSFPLVRRR